MVKNLVLTLFLFVSCGWSGEFFVKNDTDFYPTSKNENSLGLVKFATKASVLKKEKGFSFISIDGWVLEGDEDIIYKNFGVINELIVLKKRDTSKFKYLKKIEDEYEDIWHKVRITAWVKTDTLTSSMKSQWEEISSQYKMICGACHKVHPVKEFDANTWPSLLGAMADRAGLTPNSKEKMKKYLQEHAKKQ